MRRVLLIALVTVLLTASGAAAAAPARIAYLKHPERQRPQVWVANADGSGAHALAGVTGWDTAIAPDGSAVAVITQLGANGNSLMLVPVAGGAPRTLVVSAGGNIDNVAWSPDARFLAASVDLKSVVIDVATGAVTTIARGQIEGVSFSPRGDRIVYGRAPSHALFAPVDLYVAHPDGTAIHKITHDGRSLEPVWGPRKIAFTHMRLRHDDAPIFQLWLANPNGHAVRHLTHLRIPTLVSGLTAVAWSADGRRLLANYGGQDMDEAWTVDVRSGRARDLTGKVDGVIARGLSRDGRTVLVQRGFFDDTPHQSVATIPWRGGRAHVLVRHAGMPSWNR
jgi:dipeptidyl aminopeptidase/acylaminoacyl peptidase